MGVQKARILVIDDDPKITAMLRRSLTYEGFEVKTANTGGDGLQLVEDFTPNLVILDIMMPDLSGWTICRCLRENSNLPILMLTARDEVEDKVRGLETGADDYLVKPFALSELTARIRALLRRAKIQDNKPAVLKYADLVLDTGTREAKRGNETISLTNREYKLLLLFMRHPRQVLTRELIMERVWGFDYEGESNVLEVYVGMLRNKLEAGGKSRLIHTVRGAGYVLKA